MAFVLTSGERNERTALPELTSQGAVKRSGPDRPQLRPRAVVGDRGYTGKPSRLSPASRDQRRHPATQDRESTPAYGLGSLQRNVL